LEEILIEVKQLKKGRKLPAYMSENAVGMDLIAALDEDITIHPGSWALVPTGIAVALPVGYEIQIRPRSGLALNHGIGLLNSPGTVDPDYRGEISVILFNFSKKPFVVKDGDRIAQMVISSIVKARLKVVDNLPSTVRDDGGFGHTGIR